MVILSKPILRAFGARHPAAAKPLNDWFALVLAADWNSIAAMRRSYNSVDYVGQDRYIFNIGGNKFRLVARVLFPARTVYVKFVGTHAEYDAIDPATVEYKKPL